MPPFLAPRLPERFPLGREALLVAWFITGGWLILGSLRPAVQRELPPVEPVAVAADASAVQQMPAVPVRLAIPVLGLDAPVIPVGIDAQGRMDVPRSAGDVGWYALGTVPGLSGQAVFAGHVSGRWGAEGVFARLESLRTGDEILVEDAAGVRRMFRVTDARTFPADAKVEEFFGPASAAVLHLITCAGTWNGESFTQRRVVTSVAIDGESAQPEFAAQTVDGPAAAR